MVPGGTFGWHSHPGPSLIIVKSGTITFYHGDDKTCTPDVKHAGDALIDDGTDVHVGRNEGTTDVVVIVTRFLPLVLLPGSTSPPPASAASDLPSCAPMGVGAQDAVLLLRLAQ